MGFLWSRIVCAAKAGNHLSATSPFAETLDSFSTLSQEKRHEGLPSWYLCQEMELILGCLRKRLFEICGGKRMNYLLQH